MFPNDRDYHEKAPNTPYRHRADGIFLAFCGARVRAFFWPQVLSQVRKQSNFGPRAGP